jgi:hypothetical protein
VRVRAPPPARGGGGRRDGLAASLLGLGTLFKLYPAILFPLLPGRRRAAVVAAFAGVVALGVVTTGGPDHWPLGPIGRYVRDEYFNPGLVRSFVNEPALALAMTAIWVFAFAWRGGAAHLAQRAAPLATGFIVLAPSVFPWYAVWLVPLVAVTPSVPLIVFTGTVAFAYTFFLFEPWGIPWWARLVEAAPLGFAAARELRALSVEDRRARAGASAE